MGGQQGEAEGEEKEQVGRAVAYMRIAENKQNQRLKTERRGWVLVS